MAALPRHKTKSLLTVTLPQALSELKYKEIYFTSDRTFGLMLETKELRACIIPTSRRIGLNNTGV